jgi:hypothetical protein
LFIWFRLNDLMNDLMNDISLQNSLLIEIFLMLITIFVSAFYILLALVIRERALAYAIEEYFE